MPSNFLDVFGRPERKTVCECERTMETSLAQVLHLMNAPLVSEKIQSPTGRAARLAQSKLSADEIITEEDALAKAGNITELKQTLRRSLNLRMAS